MSVVCKLFTFQSSPLKLRGLLEPNFSGMMYWRSCINIPCSFWKKRKQNKKPKAKKTNNGKSCSYSYWPLYKHNISLWNYSANWNQTLQEYCLKILYLQFSFCCNKLTNKKYHNPNSSKIKYQNRRKRQMDTPTHKYNYMTTGLVQALQYKVTGLT